MKPYEAFNGDIHLEEEFIKLRDKFSIKTVIETGTYLGQTTFRLAELFEKVITIEIRKDFQDQAKERLKDKKNIEMYLGDAPIVLDEILKKLVGPILWFCDDHWQNNPMKDDFAVFKKHNIKPVICIHDMKNPGDPTMGYDSYIDQEYTFDSVQPYIELVYGRNGYRHYFNTKAIGARRGALFITPR